MNSYLPYCVLLLASFTTAFVGQKRQLGNQNPSS